MKLVIDIPDDFCDKMRKQNGMSYTEAEVVVDAFYKGTPLPKGHGRLIDADALWKKWVFDAIGKQEIDEAPTVIEAESEDK